MYEEVMELAQQLESHGLDDLHKICEFTIEVTSFICFLATH
jgi:hypothetical protein